ncbi:hypothetical protein [Glycomyces artemisiae]|uniref:Uncharacterized protein n=1 Tax=Glycomyces artemisiae TaxID=1076443 RepID=A0A2T0UAN0_9ACTN|nr:hypothetical protein [Glycomyces artemisiae]PRY54990.1 hypothetical protein B0I28_113100 [Glycomyces artemisiae]
MTYIFDVWTWGREGNTLDGTLTSLIGDGVRLGDGPDRGTGFGLKLLMDAWFQGFGATDIDPGTAAEFAECFELILGKRVWIDDEGFVLDHRSKEPVVPKVNAYSVYEGQLDGGRGTSDGHAYLLTKPRGEEFRRRADAVIASFAVDPEADGDQAGFTIRVTDPKYLAHMASHLSFRTSFTGAE